MSRSIIEIEGFHAWQEKIKQLSNPKDKKREVLMILKQVASSTVRAAKN